MPHQDVKTVVILGDYGAGKSTLADALLGGEIIPLSDEYRDLSTDTLTEIKYGESRRAVIHYRPRIPENLRSVLPDAAKASIETAGGRPIEPMEVLPYQTWDYVMAPADRDELFKASPFQKLELVLPLPSLASGLTLIDTQGYDRYSDSLNAPTREAIRQADLLLIVVDGGTLCWDLFFEKYNMRNSVLIDGELAFLEKHLPENSRVCFVINREDETLHYPKFTLRSYLANKAIRPFRCGVERIFCVDAKLALTAAVEQNARGRRRSGITGLERMISAIS